MTRNEQECFLKIKSNLDSLHKVCISLRNKKNVNEDKHIIWNMVCKIVEIANTILQNIKGICPKLKSRYLELTDAGPGVGISNHDVTLRIGQNFRSRLFQTEIVPKTR